MGMLYGRYTSHNQIPKILVDYFESIAAKKIVDIDIKDINDFIQMIEEYDVEETGAKEAPYKKAS